ncbi:putative metal-dependent hydrolase YabD [Pullulanibacillus camelliae]|uniref:Putative metal-dependent hydrolase YabD n=1 Tax=Pullulanibacillus camelliae TaxID=1707096 RepID=A0A8J2YMG5_9BACL|nr:TatD family hydrolase [Pullulanibacillus camelliae]GGE53942.1 putative metal-dependent hydrolase YabD [Pullulanibacillus camelliae]
MLFDTHTHINAEEFNEDRDEVITRAHEAGVSNMVVVGFDRPTIEAAMAIVKEHEDMYAAVGWHPVDAIDMTDEDLDWIRALLKDPKVVAVGEMGLDYHWDKSPAEIQKEVFRKQIHLAKEMDMPIIIHNREATEDIVAILEEERASAVGGIMHCYSSDWEHAKRCLDMNFYISFGGPVTFKNGHLAKEVASQVPLDRLLIETDCPYLSPHPFRGKRNEPARVQLVAEQIAVLRDKSFEEIAEITSNNAKTLFRLNR